MPDSTPSPDPLSGPPPEQAPADTSPTRRPLPWQAVVAATVLACTAAGLVLLVLSGGSSGDSGVTAGQGATGTLELSPAGEAVDRDGAIDVEFTTADDLPGIDGETGTLRELLDGRPMVVNFFASWCPPCISEMPEFEAVSQELAGRVDFVGLAVQDRPEDASRIVDQTGVSYAWARDVRGDIAGAVGVVQMPTTMLLDADGEIVDVHAGTLDADDLRTLVEKHFPS